jgi:hypothetical protein
MDGNTDAEINIFSAINRQSVNKKGAAHKAPPFFIVRQEE